MATVINKGDVPEHVFAIPELDLSEDIFAERPGGPWFKLGAWTIGARLDQRGVEDVVERQSFLLTPNHFAEIFEDFESIGNSIDAMGKPGGCVSCETAGRQVYRYAPFHQFRFPLTSVVGEPLVFVHSFASGCRLLINPDLWLFLELEERSHGNGIWWDPQRGVDAVVQRVADQGNLQVVEIRIDYLLKYLKARQMSLVVGHYRHLHLFNPSHRAIDAFMTGDVLLGSPEQGAKAILQNWGLGQDTGSAPFLQRRLHLWFEIKPPPINKDDPWADEPSFDPYTFTVPTCVGRVAPARWRHFSHTEERTFEGEECDFMDRVCFRQEVLMKYERACGFDVGDDGSVSCHHYWGLVRSTVRMGNELLSTAIGDFAEGVPFEEWPHWRQYAVEPPSPESAKAIRQEQRLPDAVNSLVTALNRLNAAVAGMGRSLAVANLQPLWRGSVDSLAGHQLKWVYPAAAGDDEFLKRATLASTLVLDELETPVLRKLLCGVAKNLHLNDDDPPRCLGSRNLLRRVTLIATLLEEFLPHMSEIPRLVKQAESGAGKATEPDLRAELTETYQRVRDQFGPLAFLYDLRTYGGLAHKVDKPHVAEAAAKLGLPRENWHRRNYLQLLNLVIESLQQISTRLETAAETISQGDSLL